MAESGDNVVPITSAVEAARRAREADPALYAVADLDEIANSAQICTDAIHKIARIAGDNEITSVISTARVALDSIVHLAQSKSAEITKS